MYTKRTKIICTISDRRCSQEFLESLYREGMNVVRINTAHLTTESAMEIVNNTRKTSSDIAILVDTKGPEVRLTSMDSETGYCVSPGEIIRIADNPEGVSTRETLYTNYAHFTQEIPQGATILIDDGETELHVESKKGSELICKVMNNSIIKGRKSVNTPGISINLPSVSKKDREFIIWAIENRVDFIAHSFVRNVNDIAQVQNILDEYGSPIKIISKIENQEGVDNIDSIIENCYGIMVARGDLGVEIEAQKIPVIQRSIIQKCRSNRKPVIIATQMLHSMIEHQRPTRAEVSDVANAVYQRTDSLMLSGETANGKHPVEAVRTMRKIAEEIEIQLSPDTAIEMTNVRTPVISTLTKAMIRATETLPITAIVIDTQSGRTGRYLSSFRPNIPVFAKCYQEHVVREFALSYGIYPFYMKITPSKDAFVKSSVQNLLERELFKREDLIGIVGGNFGDSNGATFMEISTAKNLAGE